MSVVVYINKFCGFCIVPIDGWKFCVMI